MHPYAHPTGYQEYTAGIQQTVHIKYVCHTSIVMVMDTIAVGPTALRLTGAAQLLSNYAVFIRT